MASPPFKEVPPEQLMIDMRFAILEAMTPFAESVEDIKKLAVLGHMAGQMIALGRYDERIPPDMLIEMFMTNLQTGNREAMEFAYGAGQTRQ